MQGFDRRRRSTGIEDGMEERGRVLLFGLSDWAHREKEEVNSRRPSYRCLLPEFFLPRNYFKM